MQTITKLISLGCTIEVSPVSDAIVTGAREMRVRITDPGRDTLVLLYARDAAELEAKLAAYLKER